jgi:hypothetical protein
MDVAYFFEEALPALARDRPEVFAGSSARVCVRELGGRSWTVRFSDVNTPVVAGDDIDAELVISFSPEALEAFVGGTLDVTEAAANGAIGYDGDIELLTKLGYLLQGARGELGR